jgi:adenylate cyclase
LKLRLLPEEKKAIEKRGTGSPEAYNIYLMARGYLESGNRGDPKREEAIIRLTRRATDLDPSYARAWALMAEAQASLSRYGARRDGDDGAAAAETAVALDPDLAEAHAARARVWFYSGRLGEAARESELALRLDADSYDANSVAGFIAYSGGNFEQAVSYFRRVTLGSQTDFAAPAMAISACLAIDDNEGARAFAEIALERIENVLAQDRGNGFAMGFGVSALAFLGHAERAKEWMAQDLLVDPDNMLMRYNFACMTAHFLADPQGALELLAPVIASEPRFLRGAPADPDLVSLHEDARFKAMIAEAEARFAADGQSG